LAVAAKVWTVARPVFGRLEEIPAARFSRVAERLVKPVAL
jgi:hypothetical protein